MMVKGSAAIWGYDPEILFRIASQGKTYVEIGTKWGGSAIVAGLAGCEVHCIDHWEYPGRESPATPDDVRENWVNAGLNLFKLHIHIQRHPPWPEAIRDSKFEIGLIDGSHFEEAAKLDWEAMRQHVTKFILFHDFDDQHEGVQKAFWSASEDPSWVPAEHRFGILRR